MSQPIEPIDHLKRQPLTAEQAAIREDLFIHPDSDATLARLRFQQQKALCMLTEGASVAGTARDMNLSRNTIYYWLKHDPAFAAALRAWRERTRREAGDQLLQASTDAVRVVRSAITSGNLTAALAVLRGQGVLEVKARRRSMKRLQNTKGKVVLEHEHSRTRVSVPVPASLAEAARPVLITPPPAALPLENPQEVKTPPGDSASTEA